MIMQHLDVLLISIGCTALIVIGVNLLSRFFPDIVEKLYNVEKPTEKLIENESPVIEKSIEKPVVEIKPRKIHWK
jgi:hypothetical protein